jgi:replicative DNA helicase
MFTILGHLIRNPRIIERVQDTLTDDLFIGGEAGYKLAWVISRDWFRQYQTPIPREAFYAEVERRLADSDNYMSDGEREELVEDVESIYTMSEDNIEITTDYVAKSIERELFDARQLRGLAFKLQQADPGAEFEEILKDIGNVHATTRVTIGDTTDYFSSDNIQFTKAQRVPTGLEYMDKLTNDGPAPGEVVCLAGPTGGGKTTIACELAVATARDKRYVAIFSYETEIDQDLLYRIYGLLAGIPRKIMETARSAGGTGTLPPEYLEKLKAALDKYGQYIQGFDMCRDLNKGVGTGGTAELRSMIKKREEKLDIKIEVVILDQVIPMVDSYLNARGKDLDQTRRVEMQSAMQALRNMAGVADLNCVIYALHQVRTEAKAASWSRVPKRGDGAEDRQIENFIHWFIVLGVTDRFGRCWIKTVKGREGPETQLILQMDADGYRMKFENGRYKKGVSYFMDTHVDEHALQDMHELEADRQDNPPKSDDVGGAASKSIEELGDV